MKKEEIKTFTDQEKLDLYREFSDLENKAFDAYYEMDGFTSRIYNKISQMIKEGVLPYNSHVFIQNGDGLVLAWGDGFSTHNTPIDSIVDLYLETGMLLTEKDLSSMSI